MSSSKTPLSRRAAGAGSHSTRSSPARRPKASKGTAETTPRASLFERLQAARRLLAEKKAKEEAARKAAEEEALRKAEAEAAMRALKDATAVRIQAVARGRLTRKLSRASLLQRSAKDDAAADASAPEPPTPTPDTSDQAV